MAILYTAEMTVSGITYGRRKGYINYTVSNSSTTTTVTVTDIGVAYYTSEWSGNYTYTTTGTVSATCGGTSVGSKSKSEGTVYCTTTPKLISWGSGSSVSFTRTSSNQTKTLQVSFAYSGGTPSTATGSISITVPKTASTYYLNYDANGGYNEPAPLAYTQNASNVFVNEHNYPARLGYQFLNWNTNKNGTGTTYYPGDAWDTSKQGGTLYAQWAAAIPISQTRKFIYIEDQWYPIEYTYLYNGSAWVDVTRQSRLYNGSWLYT